MLEENSSVKILQALHSYFTTHSKRQVSFVPLQDLLDHVARFDAETFLDPRSNNRHAWVNSRWLSHELRKIGLVKGPAQQQKTSGTNMKGFEIDYTELKRFMKLHGLNPNQDFTSQV